MGLTKIAARRGAVPIGGIIPFYDFDGAVPLDDCFAYCNGDTIVDDESPFDGLVLPDLSNRYLVGFGTEAGKDIGSATWGTAPVGNASHQVNLQHSHSTSHYHTMQSHTHSTNISHSHGSHSHTDGDLYAQITGYNGGTWGDSANIIRSDEVTVPSYYSYGQYGGTDGYGAITRTDERHGVDVEGTTDGTTVSLGSTSVASGGPSTANTSTENPTSTNALSTTEFVQPRSIRVRYIMRIK